MREKLEDLGLKKQCVQELYQLLVYYDWHFLTNLKGLYLQLIQLRRNGGYTQFVDGVKGYKLWTYLHPIWVLDKIMESMEDLANQTLFLEKHCFIITRSVIGIMYQLKDYLYSINQSKKNILDDDPDAVKKYPAYVVNRCLSSFTDTVLYANEMNKCSHLTTKDAI